MVKDFDNWNHLKKQLDQKESWPYYHPREIWWCSLGVNVGFEQDGTGKSFDRPVLIIKGFNTNTFFGVALTGRKRTGKYYFYLGKVADRDASVSLSQARIIDTKRLISKLAVVEEEKFNKVKAALQGVLFG